MFFLVSTTIQVFESVLSLGPRDGDTRYRVVEACNYNKMAAIR